MMSFLTPILLAGIAAFSIPLIIHLLNRRRVREISWGAMHLLEMSIRQSRRRLQLLELLLLLTRIAIPVLLALCLAGPVLRGLANFMGRKASTVILLDDSYSMQAPESGGPAFRRSREEAGALIGTLPKASEAQVVLMGAGAPLVDAPTSVLAHLTGALDGVEATAGSIDPAESIRLAGAQLSVMESPAAEVIVLSDFRRRDWGEPGEARRAEAAESLRVDGGIPEITLFPQRGGEENLSVLSAEVSALVLGRGQRFTVRANLRNHGRAHYPSVPVDFEVDGEKVKTSRVTLAAGEEAQVLFTHAFDEPGEKRITIRAAGDALEADNAYHLVLPVWKEIPVLLVNGDPADAPLEGETDFLELALRPFGAAGGGELADLIRPEVTASNRIPRDVLERVRVVVVANCRNLSGLTELKDFVREGGGLIFFPGDEVDVAWWDKEAHGARSLLLPCAVGKVGAARGTGGPEPGNGRIPAQRFTHPALAFFNDPANGSFDRVAFSLWHRLELAAAGGDDEERHPRVLLRLDNGDPLAVEHAFGKGRVIQFAVPADADWGNLPTQPVYLPLMQRLVTYLSTAGAAPREIRTGEVLRAVIAREAVREKEREKTKKELLVIDPAGREQLVPVREEDGRGVIEFERTGAPGFYRIQAADAPGEDPRFFAVNLSREESDLANLTDAEVGALAESLGARVVRSREEYAAMDRVRRLGMEVWKPLMMVVLAFLFLEMLLQQAISGRSRRPSAKAAGGA